jgi:hypothetical protein
MVANSLYWTTADLDVMPDDGGWLRHEIIAGELFVTRAPHIRHQGVGWQLQTLEIYRRTDAQLQLVATLLPGDTLTSPLLPGFSAEIDRIFS